MSDHDIARCKALKRLEELNAEIAEIKTFLRLYDKYAGDASSAVGDSPPIREENNLSGRRMIQQAFRPRGGRPTSPAELLPEIRRIILVAERPLTRGQLVQILEAEGYRLSGKDKANHIGTIMWRAKDQFVNLLSLGYWPIDVAYEAGGYKPVAATAEHGISDDAGAKEAFGTRGSHLYA